MLSISAARSNCSSDWSVRWMNGFVIPTYSWLNSFGCTHCNSSSWLLCGPNQAATRSEVGCRKVNMEPEPRTFSPHFSTLFLGLDLCRMAHDWSVLCTRPFLVETPVSPLREPPCLASDERRRERNNAALTSIEKLWEAGSVSMCLCYACWWLCTFEDMETFGWFPFASTSVTVSTNDKEKWKTSAKRRRCTKLVMGLFMVCNTNRHRATVTRAATTVHQTVINWLQYSTVRKFPMRTNYWYSASPVSLHSLSRGSHTSRSPSNIYNHIFNASEPFLIVSIELGCQTKPTNEDWTSASCVFSLYIYKKLWTG